MKKRTGYISNSSSSSFLIIGDCFETEEQALEVQHKLEPNKTHVYTHGDKFEDRTTVAGINLGGFDEYTSSDDAEEFVKSIQAAIVKCKMAGIMQPLVIGGCSTDR